MAHEWLMEWFKPVVDAIPPELSRKRDFAQLYHEVLDYRWYQSQRESRYVSLPEATQGYIRDVLRGLPDELLSSEALLPAASSPNLVNPADPAMGLLDTLTDLTPIVDPWEDSAEDIDLAAASRLDYAALLARARKAP